MLENENDYLKKQSILQEKQLKHILSKIQKE